MSEQTKQVKYELNGDAEGLLSSLGKGVDGFHNFSKQATSGLKEVQEQLEKLSKSFKLITQVFLGGAAIGELISEMTQEAGEVKQLSNAFGVTGEAANKLHIQLGLAGIATDDYVSLAMKFDKQLKTNEVGLNKLGVATRSANGELLPQQQLLKNAADTMMTYKAGTDRNAFALSAFGKSAQEAYQLLKLNNESQERANELAEKGIGINQEELTAVKEFKTEKNAAKIVMEDFAAKAGAALLPALTKTTHAFVNLYEDCLPAVKLGFEIVKAAFDAVAETVALITEGVVDFASAAGAALNEWFGTTESGMDTTGAVLNAVGGAFQILKAIVVSAFELMSNGAYAFAKTVVAVGESIAFVLAGDLSGAKKVWVDTFDAIEKKGEETGKKISGVWTEAAAKTAELGKKASEGPHKEQAPSGTKSFEDDKSKGAKQKQTWEAELAEKKLAFQEQQNLAGTFYQFTIQQELGFWQQKLALTARGTEDNLAVRRKVAELELKMGQESYAKEIASLEAKEAAFKNNTDKRLELQEQEALLVAQHYGVESKEYESMQKKMVETKRQAADQIKQIQQIQAESTVKKQEAELTAAEKVAQIEYGLHNSTDSQYLAQQIGFENQRTAIAKKGISERIAAALQSPDASPTEIAKLHAQLEELEAQHQGRLTTIQEGAAKQRSQFEMTLYNGLQSQFEQFLNISIMGSTRMGQVYRQMLGGIEKMAIQAFINLGVEQAMTAAKTAIVGALTTKQQVAQQAAVGGAAATAATAAIPIVGPALAPVAGASMFSQIMSFLSVPGYETGAWEIPREHLAMLHPGETVLPRTFAEDYRANAQGGGVGSSAGAVHLHVSAMDGASVEQLFKNNGAALGKALKQQVRRFSK